MVRKWRILQLLWLWNVLLCVSLQAQIEHRVFEKTILSYAAIDLNTAVEVQRMINVHQQRISKVIGASPGDTLHVWIAATPDNFDYYAGGVQPEWAAAVYLPSQHRIVLKSPRWHGSLSQLEEELVHELAHFYLFGSIAADIPTWYHEGIAQWLSGKQLSIDDAVTLSLAMSAGELVLLAEIDSVITFHRQRARLAYVQSLSAVQFLVELLGAEQRLMLLHRQVPLVGWDAALQTVIGVSSPEFEVLWYRNLEQKYRWLGLLGGDNFLWLLMVALFLLGVVLVRWRNYRKLRRWRQEESLNED